MLLVYLLVFVSGSKRFMQSPDMFLILVFGISAVAWLLYSDRKISDRFILYVVIFTGFLLVINLYTGGSLSLSSVLGTVLKLLLAFLILKTVGDEFMLSYIKVIVLLAAISLFGYLIDSYNLFAGLVRTLPRVGQEGYEGFFYLFGFRNHIERNNSIFYEPGAYQIFLNSALFMLFFAGTGINKRRLWLYTIVLVTTLLSTFSTTGFLIFAVVFALFLLRSNVLDYKGKTVLVGVLAAAALMFAAQFQHTVFEKLNDYLDIEHIADSSNLRSFDPLIDMQIFRRHVFGAGHDRYLALFSQLGLVSDGHTSSNGITRMFAIYGLPFSLFLFGSYLWAFRRLLDGFLMSTAAFGMLVMVFIGESYYLFTPVCLAIIVAPFIRATGIQGGLAGTNGCRE